MKMEKLASFVISSAVDSFGSFSKCPAEVKSMMIEKVCKKFGVKEIDLIAEIATILAFGENK